MKTFLLHSKFFYIIAGVSASFLFFQGAFAATESVSLIRQDCTGYTQCYTSLSAWESAQQKDLVSANEIAVARIEGTWTNSDATAVSIDGWTTDATRYIKIYTAADARHSGVWNTGKYRLEPTNTGALRIQEDYVRVDGLQIGIVNPTTQQSEFSSVFNQAGEVVLSNSIIRGSGANSIGISVSNPATGSLVAYNNIVYNAQNQYFGGLRYGGSGTVWAYNNTFVNCYYGIRRSEGTIIAKNNLIVGSVSANYVSDGAVAWGVGSNYNSSSDATSTGGSNDKINQTIAFANSGSNDYHLSSSASAVINAGVDLSADTGLAFTTDIDGETRSGSWDIGADEYGSSGSGAFPTSSQNTYYVSPSGSASWVQCVSTQTPCSWQTAMANAQAGDTVYFRGGTYEPGIGNQFSAPVMYPTHDGTADAPITFAAYPGEVAVIHDASFNAVAPANNTKPAIGCYQNSYVVWDGFSFVKNLDNGYQASSIVRFELSDHCTLKNSDLAGRSHFDYANGALISIVQSSYIYIHNNKLHGMSRDPNAIEATVNTTAIWTFDHDHVSIYNNDFYDNYGNISTKIGTSYLNIYNNHIWNCGHSAVRVVPQVSGTTDISIYQNVIRNCPVVLSSPDPAALLYNVKLYNNTVYNSGTGTLAEVGSPSYQYHRNTEIFNNIISNQGSNSLFGRYFNSMNFGAGFPTYMNYNDFHGTGRWNMNYATDHTTLFAWQAVSGADINSIVSSPLFVSPGGVNPEHYKLQAGSPARIGRGGSHASVMGAYITGSEVIGALTQQSGPQPVADTTPPSIPANLSATTVSTSQINISWSASADSVGVSGYRVYRNGVQITTTIGTSYVDSGLTASTAYAYAVSAYDAAGNNSGQTASVSAITQTIVIQPIPVPSSSGAPIIFYTDIISGPNTGGENNNGAYLSIFGKNFGTSLTNIKVYVGNGEVARSMYLGASLGRPDVQQLSVQLGPNTTTGAIKVSVSGVDSNTDQTFTVRAGNIYFVGTTGNNSNAGSFTSPWRTIAYGKSRLWPGDILYIMDGTNQVENDPLGMGDAALRISTTNGSARAGTQDNPIALVAYPGAKTVIGCHITNCGTVIRVYLSGWVFSGLTLKGGSNSFSGTIALNDYLSPLYNIREVNNDMTSGYYGAHAYSSSNVYFFGNSIHDMPHSAWYYGGGVSASNIHVGWNYIHNVGTPGEGIYGIKFYYAYTVGSVSQANRLTTDIFVHDNVIHDTAGAGILIGGADWGGYPWLKDVSVYNNVIYKTGRPNEGAIRIGNVGLGETEMNLKMYNNTLYANSRSLEFAEVKTAHIANNIFAQTNGGNYTTGNSNVGSFLMHNNAYFGGTAIPSIETSAVSGDPRFVSPTSGDLRLQSSSPAINTGSSLVSTMVTKDHNGIARPQGSAYDIGAYEYCTACTASSPSIPPTTTQQTPSQPTPTPASTPTPTSSPSAPAPTSTGGSLPAPASSSSSAPQTQTTASSGIKEGSLIRGPDGIKVYIVNAHGYKRHIFNPAIFSMYGHFKWNEIRSVSQQTLDSYITSDLYRADGDIKVFSLHEIDEAKGLAQKRWFNLSATAFMQKGYTFTQVFIINPRERDYYQEGVAITN